jgi:hypothetical protein
LRKDSPKNKAKDDFADALRYAITRIPWDWTAIGTEVPEDAPAELSPVENELAERRKQMQEEENDAEFKRVEEELTEWQALFDG